MMIQSIMLVALGFFVGALLTLILLPALWRRAVRLTTERITSSMPVSLSEIRADKDRMRAEYAIKIRHFEVELEKAQTRIAKQRIEISRRDAQIDSLQSQIAALSMDVEEQKNAKKVLEQTVASRLPKLEAQLDKAKELLGIRFQEITKLKVAIDQREDKLDEARQMENVRQSELERMRMALDQSYEEKRRAELAAEKQAEFEALFVRNEALEGQIEELTQALTEATAREEQETMLLKSEMHKLADQMLARPNGSVQPEPSSSKSETTVDGGEEKRTGKAPLAADEPASAPDDHAPGQNIGDQKPKVSVVEDGDETAAAEEDDHTSEFGGTKKRLRLRERLKGLQIRNSR